MFEATISEVRNWWQEEEEDETGDIMIMEPAKESNETQRSRLITSCYSMPS